MIDGLRSLRPRDWRRALLYSGLATLLIAVPSDLIDTPIFGRDVETWWVDYAILVVTSALIGLIFAIRPESSGTPGPPATREGDSGRALWGGFASFLAVGCPVCNKAVVALLGTSGALAWWAPLQPVLGLAAVGLLLYTLRKRLLTYRLVACPVSVASSQ